MEFWYLLIQAQGSACQPAKMEIVQGGMIMSMSLVCHISALWRP